MAKLQFVSAKNPAVVYLDDDGVEVEAPEVEAPPAVKAPAPKAEQLPKYLKDRAKKPVKRSPRTADRPGALLIAALFGFAAIVAVWQFGASTTVGFLHEGLNIYWYISVDLKVLTAGFLPLVFKLDMIWLIPIGITYFQMVYKPPLDPVKMIIYFLDDPVMTVFWLLFTAIGVTTSFFGLILWLKTLKTSADLTNPVLWLAAAAVAVCIEYYCEPLILRFAGEIREALRRIKK